jgi:hypothetical protein
MKAKQKPGINKNPEEATKQEQRGGSAAAEHPPGQIAARGKLVRFGPGGNHGV